MQTNKISKKAKTVLLILILTLVATVSLGFSPCTPIPDWEGDLVVEGGYIFSSQSAYQNWNGNEANLRNVKHLGYGQSVYIVLFHFSTPDSFFVGWFDGEVRVSREMNFVFVVPNSFRGSLTLRAKWRCVSEWDYWN